MALLQSGTRIYGVANVDTQIYVGSNVSINTTGFSVTGNATTIPTLSFYSNATAGVLTIGNSTSTSLPTMSLANSTGNVTVTPISVAVGTAGIVNTTGIYHTGVINSASHTVGTSLVANSTGVYHTGVINSASHTVGTSLVANSTGIYHTGVINSASYTVGTSLVANLTGVYHTGTVNAAVHSVGTTFIVNTSQITIATTPLSANGGVGTAGQVLTSNGATGAPYWSTVSGGGGGGFTNGQSIQVSNVYATVRVGYVNTTSNTSVAYTFWNANLGTLDTVFG